MKHKKGTYFLKIVVGFIISIALFMGICEAISEDISSGIVRLHVIANSNSAYDQRVKLLVRDAILEESARLAQSEDVTLSFIDTNRAQLIEAANAALEREGADYRCQIQTGRFSFPTKRYESVTLPAGDYDAVRVVLGAGDGENWWCVMYPPLCFQGASAGALNEDSEAVLSGNMSPQSYAMIKSEAPRLRPAFRALELWQALKERVRN